MFKLLLFAGCLGGDTSITPAKADNDGDGFTIEVDCDDSHAAVNPDAVEICDELDNDCDGNIDEEPTDGDTFYADTDRDSFGTSTSSKVACAAPNAFVVDKTDCDDTQETVFPGGTEVCDGLDNDCNGQVDDDPVDLITVYTDGDGDGYGDDSTSVQVCEASPGEVEQGGDCNDGNAAIYLGAPEPDCSDPTDYNCDGDSAYDDVDADGTAACLDCDDQNAAVNPSALEICNNIDDDCDGAIDDDDSSLSGTPTWYQDLDGDGYGDSAWVVSQCEAPSSYVGSGGDCDDGQISVNPGATEICDSADSDEDCDGLADDNDSNVSGLQTWYSDSDADGYGGSSSITACDPPSGYVSTGGDCNDSDSAVSPGDMEVCRDSVDNDCDNSVDEDCVSQIWSGSFTTADYDSKIYGDETGDNFGSSIAAADFNNDGIVDIAVGAEADEYSSAYNSYGTTYVYMGNLNPGVETCTTSDDAFLYNTSSSYVDFGEQLWAVPDMNGDSKPELIIAADNNGYDWDVLAFRGGSLTGSANYSSAYYSSWNCSDISGAGNFYAGGSHYLACGDVSSSTVTGTVWVYGDSSTTALATLNGEVASDFAGNSVDLEHDFDGDGINDALIGAYGNDGASSNAGAAYVVWGPVSGTFNLSGADFKVTGAGSSNNLGYQVAGGDLNDDGDPDLIIGAPYYDYGSRSNAGAVYVFTTIGSGTVSSTTADQIIYGESSNDLLGTSSLSTGDVDDDGATDLLLSSGEDDGTATDAGASWLIYGPLSASWDLSNNYDARWRGEGSYYYAGGDAIIAGDIDGDGIDDVVIAGAGADERGYTEHGAIWLFLGG